MTNIQPFLGKEQNKYAQISIKKTLEVTTTISVCQTPIDIDTPFFSEINIYYTPLRPTKEGGIINYLSLNGLRDRLNNFKRLNGFKKDDNPAILKGIFSGGTSGAFCSSGAPFLFFDIDVKENENQLLLNSFQNNEVFQALKDVCVLVWRSNSGKGMGGILYTPGIEQYNNSKSQEHLKVGKSITDKLQQYLKEKTSIIVKFDQAQSKFRQIRYLADQKEEQRFINAKPFIFSFTTKEIEAKTMNGGRDYNFYNTKEINGTIFTTNRLVKGSIREQYNNQHNILDVAKNVGFDVLNNSNGTARIKHPRTTSSSSGVVDLQNNIYYNFSQSVSTKGGFDAFGLALLFEFNDDYGAFLGALNKQGYEHIKPQLSDVKNALNKLKASSTDREMQIADACFDLRNASFQDKQLFINEGARNEQEKLIFYDHLKFKKLKINYDYELKIEKYVSECVSDIIKIAELDKMVIVKAETGAGKTVGLIKYFENTNKRVLMLEPLTIIVDQTENENQGIVCLSGTSGASEHQMAKCSNFVTATYEQGAEHLKNNEKFDFVIIDEAHQLLSANGYKSGAIKYLTESLKNYTCIGLTGTPNPIFSNLGFKLINVEKKEQQRVDVIKRTWNIEPTKIILNHLKDVKGKAIFRLNEVKTLRAIKDTLIKEKFFKESEILVLYSDKQIKNGADFKNLSGSRKFLDHIKIVLTTSIIDEGLSIEQEGFSDVVFIETNYNPTPESLKQFFARFRNDDANRNNYYYCKLKKDQDIRVWDMERDYADKIKMLNLDKETEYKSGYKSLLADDNYYYSDGSINHFYTAYDVTKSFFENISNAEFDFFISENYNINIIKDLNFLKSKIDKDVLNNVKTFKNNIKENIFLMWRDCRIEVFNSLYIFSQDKKLKSEIKPLCDLKQGTDSYVLDNLKDFEMLGKRYCQIVRFNVSDDDEINTYLFKKGIPTPTKEFNNKMIIWNTNELINNPKTATDLKNKAKIISFINDIATKKTFTISQFFKLWKSKNVINSYSYKTEILLSFLEQFFQISRKNDMIFFTEK